MSASRSLPVLLWFALLLLTGCSSPGAPSTQELPALPTQAAATRQEPESSPSPAAPSLPTSPPPSPLASPTPAAPPSSTPTPAPPPCLKQGGRKEAGSLETPLLRQPLEFLVYLPPCYDEEPERRYPVLYLIHGQSYNQDQWDRLGADELVDQLYPSGELPPFMIVMPRDRVWTQPTEDLFGQAVAEVLIPYIDRTYRSLPDRAYRAVGGLSRGGGWAVHLGIHYRHLFGALGGHSPAIFHTDTQHLRSILTKTPLEELPRIYLDIGDKDRPEILRSALWFENLLTELGIPHRWHLFSGYHEEAYWSAHLESYLRWYAQDWEVGL